MSTHVATVKCPECGRSWTGHFQTDKTPSEVLCKECKPVVEDRQRRMSASDQRGDK